MGYRDIQGFSLRQSNPHSITDTVDVDQPLREIQYQLGIAISLSWSGDTLTDTAELDLATTTCGRLVTQHRFAENFASWLCFNHLFGHQD